MLGPGLGDVDTSPLIEPPHTTVKSVPASRLAPLQEKADSWNSFISGKGGKKKKTGQLAGTKKQSIFSVGGARPGAHAHTHTLQ
jgi:hypothetical protein